VQVHVIDDDPAVRQMLASALESASLASRLYASAEDFLDAFTPGRAGCIVLDLKMPGMGGLELLRRLHDMTIELPIVVISGHAEVPDAVQAMQLGAVDLLQKPFRIATLLELVRRALQQSADSLGRSAKRAEIRERFASLSPRQLELLKYLVAGNSSKQIATAMHISVLTVSNHRAHLMAKIKAANSADLVRLAATAGMISID
jgi:two-component system, LuxR family, response regulator FixJ